MKMNRKKESAVYEMENGSRWKENEYIKTAQTPIYYKYLMVQKRDGFWRRSTASNRSPH